MQNLPNLRVNYPRRFLHVSILLISDCTLRLFKKLVKRKFQEEVTGSRENSTPQPIFGEYTYNSAVTR